MAKRKPLRRLRPKPDVRVWPAEVVTSFMNDTMRWLREPPHGEITLQGIIFSPRRKKGGIILEEARGTMEPDAIRGLVKRWHADGLVLVLPVWTVKRVDLGDMSSRWKGRLDTHPLRSTSIVVVAEHVDFDDPCVMYASVGDDGAVGEFTGGTFDYVDERFRSFIKEPSGWATGAPFAAWCVGLHLSDEAHDVGVIHAPHDVTCVRNHGQGAARWLLVPCGTAHEILSPYLERGFEPYERDQFVRFPGADIVARQVWWPGDFDVYSYVGPPTHGDLPENGLEPIVPSITVSGPCPSHTDDLPDDVDRLT